MTEWQIVRRNLHDRPTGGSGFTLVAASSTAGSRISYETGGGPPGSATFARATMGQHTDPAGRHGLYRLLSRGGVGLEGHTLFWSFSLRHNHAEPLRYELQMENGSSSRRTPSVFSDPIPPGEWVRVSNSGVLPAPVTAGDDRPVPAPYYARLPNGNLLVCPVGYALDCTGFLVLDLGIGGGWILWIRHILTATLLAA